ncbi:hypothetical protein C0J52_10979 [Blattella germanica]|nr:hypothetical protein C0J52_10979 [Blattella germanica]
MKLFTFSNVCCPILIFVVKFCTFCLFTVIFIYFVFSSFIQRPHFFPVSVCVVNISCNEGRFLAMRAMSSAYTQACLDLFKIFPFSFNSSNALFNAKLNRTPDSPPPCLTPCVILSALLTLPAIVILALLFIIVISTSLISFFGMPYSSMMFSSSTLLTLSKACL